MKWIFVDDHMEEAASFAAALGRGPTPLDVEVLRPSDAERRLLTEKVVPSGVLMDVDLSDAGDRESGPGFAQHIRVKQKAGDIAEYPVVRFSGREQIAKNILGDPASDDLFDLKIQKEEVAPQLGSVQRRLSGLVKIYAGLAAQSPSMPDAIPALLGVVGPSAEWSHQGFHERLLAAMDVGAHVAASAFMRGFIAPTGLLLGDEVLSFRLGVDVTRSASAWTDLREELPFRYQGLGSEQFDRWWARGLEDWWFSVAGAGRPLSTLSIEDRCGILSEVLGINGIVTLVMPHGSAGDKPWRACALTLETEPTNYIPVDPAEAVRLTPRVDLPPWVDPLYAALGPALQSKDFRLNRADLDRLHRKYRD